MCENMLVFQNGNQDKYDLMILSLFRCLHLSSHLMTENIKYALHVMYFVLAPNSSSTTQKMPEF